MANLEEKRRKVLNGLLHCGVEPESKDDCGDCPYRDPDDDFYISHLCRDAYGVIVTMDTTINAMMGAYGDSCDVGKCGGEG